MEENQTLRARLQHAESALQHSKQRRQSSSSTFGKTSRSDLFAFVKGPVMIGGVESAEVASAKASLKQRTLELALEQEVRKRRALERDILKYYAVANEVACE